MPYVCVGSTELARTVALLAVEALEMSLWIRGRAECMGLLEERSSPRTCAVVFKEAPEVLVLGAGEGSEPAAGERGIEEE